MKPPVSSQLLQQQVEITDRNTLNLLIGWKLIRRLLADFYIKTFWLLKHLDISMLQKIRISLMCDEETTWWKWFTDEKSHK